MKSLFDRLLAARFMNLRGAFVLLWMLATAFGAVAVDPPPAASKFDELVTRDMTYKRVTVIDVSKTHVSFRSAQGFATVRIADLDPNVQTLLRGGTVELGGTTEPDGNTATKDGKGMKVNARESGEDEDEEEDDCEGDEDDGFKIQWTPRNIVGVIVGGIGLLALVVGHIWFICAGFHTSVLWGICLIIGGFVLDIMFCVGHWEAARRPLYLQLLGLGIMAGGWKILSL